MTKTNTSIPREEIQVLVDAADSWYQLLIQDDPESFDDPELVARVKEIDRLRNALTTAEEDGFSR